MAACVAFRSIRYSSTNRCCLAVSVPWAAASASAPAVSSGSRRASDATMPAASGLARARVNAPKAAAASAQRGARGFGVRLRGTRALRGDLGGLQAGELLPAVDDHLTVRRLDVHRETASTELFGGDDL